MLILKIAVCYVLVNLGLLAIFIAKSHKKTTNGICPICNKSDNVVPVNLLSGDDGYYCVECYKQWRKV